MPPAPWHTGIPPTAPTTRLAAPSVRARRLGVTDVPRAPKYTRAASAGARQELVKVSGTCGSTSRVAAVASEAREKCGRARADGPHSRLVEPAVVATATTRARATTPSTSLRGQRSSAAVRTTATAIAREGVGAKSNSFGGCVSSPHAILTKVRPTASCTPRVTATGKMLATRSSRPVVPSTRNSTPMISAPEAITSTPAPDAIATAAKALSGWTASVQRPAHQHATPAAGTVSTTAVTKPNGPERVRVCAPGHAVLRPAHRQTTRCGLLIRPTISGGLEFSDQLSALTPTRTRAAGSSG